MATSIRIPSQLIGKKAPLRSSSNQLQTHQIERTRNLNVKALFPRVVEGERTQWLDDNVTHPSLAPSIAVTERSKGLALSIEVVFSCPFRRVRPLSPSMPRGTPTYRFEEEQGLQRESF